MRVRQTASQIVSCFQLVRAQVRWHICTHLHCCSLFQYRDQKGFAEPCSFHSRSPESLMNVDVSRAYFHAKGSEVCAGEIASRKLFRKGQRENRTVEEEHVRYQSCSKQVGTRVPRASDKLGMRDGAHIKKPAPVQDKGNLGFDTQRRFCGDRFEGESVGAQEAAGELVPNLSEHHQGRFGKEYQGPESESTLGRGRDIVYQHDPPHVDILVEKLGLENGNTVQTPVVDDVQGDSPVW